MKETSPIPLPFNPLLDLLYYVRNWRMLASVRLCDCATFGKKCVSAWLQSKLRENHAKRLKFDKSETYVKECKIYSLNLWKTNCYNQRLATFKEHRWILWQLKELCKACRDKFCCKDSYWFLKLFKEFNHFNSRCR